jgi:hypothetical protein
MVILFWICFWLEEGMWRRGEGYPSTSDLDWRCYSNPSPSSSFMRLVTVLNIITNICTQKVVAFSVQSVGRCRNSSAHHPPNLPGPVIPGLPLW